MDGQPSLQLQRLLTSILRSLANYPDEVIVEMICDDEGNVFEVQANPEDLGRMIGKNGQTARALQLIINANWRKTGKRFEIDFLEND